MEQEKDKRNELLYVLIGSLFLISGIVQLFFLNYLWATASIVIVVCFFSALILKRNKKFYVIFGTVAALNFTGYFINKYTWLSILGIIAFVIGTLFTIIGIIRYYKSKGKIVFEILFTLTSCILVFFCGFLSLTFITPETTMSLFAKAIMGSIPANITEAKQSESTLEDGTILISDVKYDSQAPNGFLDIYYTTKKIDKNAPTFIFIHGGYVWGDKVIGDPNMIKEGPTDLITTNFLEEGYNVVQIDYALTPEYQFPVAIKQLNRGLDFLVQHGQEYNLDMTNVVIGGGSAGGNLAGLLVNIQTNPEYALLIDEKAVIDRDCIKGVYFLAALFDNSRFGCTGSPEVDWMFTQLGRLYLGINELKTNTDVVTPTNVTEYITAEFPPTFISDGNTGTFNEQAFDAYNKLKNLGVDVEICYFSKNETKLTHGHEGNDTECSRIMYGRLFDFLIKYVE